MFPLLLLVLVFHPLVLSLLKFVADVLIVDDAQQSECFTTVLRTVIIALLVADTMMTRSFKEFLLSNAEAIEQHVKAIASTEEDDNEVENTVLLNTLHLISQTLALKSLK